VVDLLVLVWGTPVPVEDQGLGSGLALGMGEPAVVSELVVEGLVD
jgi:hypothetical protein